MASEQEMMADLATADAAGDHELAQHIAAQIKAARAPAAVAAPMSIGERLKNAAHGTAGLLPMAGAILGGAGGGAAGAAGGPLGSVLLGAAGAGLLSAAGKSGQHAIDSALGYEKPDLAATTADALGTGGKDAAITAIGGMAVPVIAKGASALGSKLLDAATAARMKIADYSAKPLEATARSARSTAGAAHANASRAIERLGMTEALPAGERAANEAALATPEAEQLATGLAQKTRADLPGKLGQVQNADALAQQAEADAQAARSPEAVQEAAAKMRRDVAARLLTRYLLPAGGGAIADKLLGGSGAMGAMAGLGMRPTARALLRAISSPAVVEPVARNAAELLRGAGQLGSAAAMPIAAGGAQAMGDEATMVRTKLEAILAELRKKRAEQSSYLGSNP